MAEKTAIQLEIRRLREGDEALGVAAIRELKESGLTSSPGHMRRLLVMDENYFCVVTEGRRPIGFLVAHRFPRVDEDSSIIYLYELGVHPDYRRMGVGSAMVNLLKQDCRDRNIKKIWVGTAADNVAAKRLFESTGATFEREDYVEYVYDTLS